jgi:hypothetical protein
MSLLKIPRQYKGSSLFAAAAAVGPLALAALTRILGSKQMSTNW